MKRQILLMACSKAKLKEPAEAWRMYRGAIFRKGWALAERNGWQVYILSAKYGWLAPSDVIEPYEQKRTSVYRDGVWPPGSGFYLGGRLYFGAAPERFKPLVPALQMGYQLQALCRLLAGEDRSAIFADAKQQP
jgi:hypothetical protein